MDRAEGIPGGIFRPDALRRYEAGQTGAVLPPLVAPRTFACLWGLLGLVVVGLALAGAVRVPETAAGPAVVVEAPGGEQAVVVFLPPDALDRVRPGQPLRLTPAWGGDPLRLAVSAVEPEIVGPADLRRRFGAATDPALLPAAPSVVVRARLVAPAGGLPSAAYDGAGGRAEVEIGKRRALSLVPGLDGLA